MMRPLVVSGACPLGLLVWPVSICGATGGSAIAGSGASASASFTGLPAGITAAIMAGTVNQVKVTVAAGTAAGAYTFTVTDGGTAYPVSVKVV